MYCVVVSGQGRLAALGGCLLRMYVRTGYTWTTIEGLLCICYEVSWCCGLHAYMPQTLEPPPAGVNVFVVQYDTS